jgi:carbon storage regulator
MLVLSRKVGERVRIGRNMAVTVVGLNGNRVKLAFDCPEEVPVFREEVYQRIQAEKDALERNSQCEESPYYAEFA